MAYLIKETYLRDLQPKQMFDYYLSKDLKAWVTNINQMFITNDKCKAVTTMEFVLHKEAIKTDHNGPSSSRTTAEVVEKDDDYLAKLFLGTTGYGV